MKCPKCGYIGFESAEKCRNCGYDFSLVLDPAHDPDLPLARDEVLGAPADLTFRPTPTPVPSSRRSAQSAAEQKGARTIDPRVGPGDLPLFGLDPATPSRAGSAMTPAAASRARVTPPSPRLRPRVPARTEPTPQPFDLGLDASPAPDTSTPAVSHPVRHVDDGAAGSLARAFAGLLDASILAAVNLGVLYFTLRVCRLTFADIGILPFGPLIAFFVLLDGAYLVAFTMNGGQTIGKMAAGIRVVGEESDSMTFGQAMVRAAGYIASALPAGLGFVPGLFGPSRRALHDRLANTRVVRA